MITQFTTRRTVTAVAGAVAVGVAIASAPPAAAGPAPDFVESSYLLGLNDNGLSFPTAQGRSLALQLGYLVCALDLTGGAQPAGAEVFLAAAQTRGLCSYVSVNGQPSERQLREEFGDQARTALDLGRQQGDQVTNGRILETPPDKDFDGIPNEIDSKPDFYNP